MRLSLSAEEENRVHSCGFDSLILALNQVIAKSAVESRADCYVDQPCR